MSTVAGRAWVFGDNINTDILAPGIYMKSGPEEMAKHCLETLDPDFAAAVRPGDIVVGGENFGMGSSREQAAMALKTLGVGAVLAKSFARIFYRNALNIGLPAIIFAEAGTVAAGDALSLDVTDGALANLTQGKDFALEPIPPHLMAVIADGGLLAHLKKRIAAGEIP